MTAYYNEIDAGAAAMLRSLIEAGEIAPGIVDERSIEDVRPDELMGYTQCHFFAGIGIWSLALRQAGLPDDYPIWSMSCPCQPFSAAGKGAGFADERHLWPSAYHLISQCKPQCVIGEQVASKATDPWFDLVQFDMEGMGYAFGCVPFPSAGVGAPHLRDRAYWVADSGSARLEGRWCAQCHGQQQIGQTDALCQSCIVANTPSDRQQRSGARWQAQEGSQPRPRFTGKLPQGLEGQRAISGMANPIGERCERDTGTGRQAQRRTKHAGNSSGLGPTNGHWASADWLYCRDGTWRPVEPESSPLAYGLPHSMGAMSPELQRLAELAGLSKGSLKAAKRYRSQQLQGYGNAINSQAATAFIEAYLEAIEQ